MKKLILGAFVLIIGQFSQAQTAVNFTCADCTSNNHDLFAELNAGKIIVIAWVMPCATCIAPALEAYTEVQNFPGEAYFYLADDVANTNCSTLSSWANTNGMTACNAVFSDVLVNMSGYGEAGMPKVIVVGGASHTVYYNQNGGAITSSGINSAISLAIADKAAGVYENKNSSFTSLNVFPNPAGTSFTLYLNLSKRSEVKIEIQNVLGEKITDVFNGILPQGENSLKINTSGLSCGNYFINCNDGSVSGKTKLIVLN